VINPDGFLAGIIQFPSGGQATNLVFVPVEGQEGDDVWVVGGDSVWKIGGAFLFFSFLFFSRFRATLTSPRRAGLKVTGVRIE
jgi:hypothetical protein